MRRRPPIFYRSGFVAAAVVVLCVLLLCPAAAAVTSPPPPPGTTPVPGTLIYDGYWGGLKAGVVIGTRTYEHDRTIYTLDVHSVGLIRLTLNFKGKIQTQARPSGNREQPVYYDFIYTSRTKNRQQGWRQTSVHAPVRDLYPVVPSVIRDADRIGIIDPLTLMLRAGRDTPRGGKKVWRVYDGKYRFNATTVDEGIDPTKNLRRLTVKLDPIAGIKTRKFPVWRAVDIQFFYDPDIADYPVRIYADTGTGKDDSPAIFTLRR